MVLEYERCEDCKRLQGNDMELGLTPFDFSDLSARSLTDQAAFAERLGYRSFWLPENHFNPHAIPDPLTQLAAVAAGTESMKLATTSYLLPLRNPLLAAEQVAVLDHLSGGRVLLGVGRGYSKETLHAFDINPKTKRELFEWSLDLMIRAWSGEPVSLHEDGTSAVVVEPRPLQQPHPPVWVAAFGPKALAQAGRLGLPYLASPVETLDELVRNYERCNAAASDAGHAPPAERPFMRTVFVSQDRRTLAAVRENLGSVKLPRGLDMPKAIDDWAVIGEPDYVADRLAAYVEALHATHLVVTRLRLEGVSVDALKESIATVPSLVRQ